MADTALDRLVAELVLSVRDWIPDAARAALPELARLALDCRAKVLGAGHASDLLGMDTIHLEEAKARTINTLREITG